MELPKLKKVNPNKIKKKKILLLGDDLRLHSGVGTMSREFVLGTLKKYDWVQIGGAIEHPDKGKVVDMSDDAIKITGVEDASVKIYPVSGYGDQNLLRYIIENEKPDAIVHFTDPRFWIWLYQMEHEVRQQIPIMYYNIWDDLPDPKWNENFYESCDSLMAISKQTYGINKRVRSRKPLEKWQLNYVPHGINDRIFKPLDQNDPQLKEVSEGLFGENKPEFVVFWNNRNVRRKQPGDVILSYKEFCDNLSKEEAEKCALLMHTPIVDDNGTDLGEVVKNCCPNYRVVFSTDKLPSDRLNCLYNLSDVVLNIASNEGFGLSGAEALLSGTGIINNVTGGLQDHCGFGYEAADTWDAEGKTTSTLNKYFTAEDYVKIGSLHKASKWKEAKGITHGEWATPVWPSNRSLQGSPQTPYIFDDRASYEDVAIAISEWYGISKDERVKKGLAGREWAMNEGGLSAENMCNTMIHAIESTFENWTPREKYELIAI